MGQYKMTYLAKILAADVIDLKPRLKQKKVDDKVKKEENLQPQWDKASLRVYTSSAYAGGYELSVTVPVPAAFLKDKKKNNEGEFITQLHTFINDRTGKWMGQPYINDYKNQRAKNDMLTIKAYWHFEDPFLAYSLGLDLTEWHGSNEVVDKAQIPNRMNLAEKAFKDMQNFRNVSLKKVKLRSQDKDERNKVWRDEFMPEWDKLADKWKEKGLSYVPLVQSRKERAVGFVHKIESHYVAAAEDPIWTENQALQKLLKVKVKEITKIEKGSHGITSILVSFPTHNVEVTIGYDKDSSLTYDAFKIVDGSIASSKTGLKSRDEVVKAVTDLAK
jgi:hypothetical protein